MTSRMLRPMLGSLLLLFILVHASTGALVMEVNPYPAPVYVNAPPDLPVLNVIGRDNITGEPIRTYEFSKGVNSSYFRIDQYGRVLTAKTVDRPVRTVMTFFVFGFMDGSIESKHIMIRVTEKNEYAPHFISNTYEFNVYRYGVGETVGKVEAVDNDTENYNRILHYELPTNDDFVIHDNGSVVMVKSLSLQFSGRLQLPIMAVDTGSPQRRVTANLVLNIQEIRQPHSFCFTTLPGSTRVCWKNPMPSRAVPGYNVIVVSPISRQDFVPAQPGQEEICHVVNGTRIGNVYHFRVEIPTNSTTPGTVDDGIWLNVTNYGFSPQCMTENFDSCHYLQPCGNGGKCAKDGQDQTSSYTCACAAGWRGRNCTEQDLCYVNPCQNSAPCLFLGHRQYRCECTDNTFGQNCQHFNVCSSSPCRNRGTCRMQSDGTYDCLCPPNFSGAQCQTPDPCTPSPCFRGTCQRISTVQYRCNCIKGFYGFDCDEYNICILEEPCLNNGTCHHLGNNSYGCSCTPEWTGPICELFNPCSQGICQNNATCTATQRGSYNCHCAPGFYGNECQSFDPCHNDPCHGHGKCQSSGGGARFTCDCERGYFGNRCEFFNPCAHSPCQHGGACRNISSDIYVCDCLPEWEGENCQHLNGCSVVKCENGAGCESRYPYSYTCKCTPGYYGERCTFFNPCVSNPCQQGGICTNTSSNNYRCRCSSGYSGVNCELFNPCISDPCKNGGSCRRVSDTEVACTCTSGYLGKACEKRHPCSLSPCKNGGSCSMTSLTTRKCTCAELYFGDDCEQYDHCASRPCEHGACYLGNASVTTIETSTADPTSTFLCQCDPGYTGARCELQTGSCKDRGCLNGGTCQENTCACTSEHTGPLCETRISQMRPHCPASETRDATGRYDWPLMYVGMTTYLVCANADSEGGHASRRCGQDEAGEPVWVEPDTDICLATGLAEAGRKLQELKSLTEDASQLSPHEVSNFTSILEEVQLYSLVSKTIADDMVTVVSNLNAVNVSVMLLSDASNQTSIRLVQLLESYTRDIHNSSVVITTANINLNARDVDVRRGSTSTVAFSPVLMQGNHTEETAIKLTLPPLGDELGLKQGRVRVQFVAYKQSLLFMPSFLDPDSENMIRSQSVVTAIVKGKQLRNLTKPVVIKLPNIEGGGNHSCYYWDTEKREWASAGVVTSSREGNTTECFSYHLTSFAILLDPSPDFQLSAVHEEVLTYISYVGSAISMLGLLLTILTYALFRCLHGEKSGKILLNLCVSLLLLNVAFLMGSQHSSKYGAELCVTVAVMLHYFLLTSLLWMLVEALEMYQALITVFSKYARFYLVKRCLFAWGLPVVIVGITLAVDLSHYKAAKDFCFISQASVVAYYVALVAPACIILLINTAVFILVARVILQPRFQQQQRQGSDSNQVTPAQIRGAFTVMILLGVTWVFGPLAINEAKVVFNYLFCILNSLQGFLIFIFRCLFNPEARLAWLYLIKTGKLKRKRGPIKSMDSDTTSKVDSKSRTNGHYTGTIKTNIMQTNGWHHPKLNGCPKDAEFCNGTAARYFDMNASDGSDKVFTTQENLSLSKKSPLDSSSGDVEEEFTNL